jgi:hypothetical protein
MTAEEWNELHHCADVDEARRIATTIAAMGFEVRVRDLGEGGTLLDGAEKGDAVGPFALETPADQHADLAEVLGEIIDEQAAFDAALAARDRRRDTQGRWLLWLILAVAAASVVAVLVVAGRRASGAVPSENALENSSSSVYLSCHA